MLFNFHLHKVEITHPSILIPDLPDEFNNYRIAQISDFHLGTWLKSRDMHLIVELVNLQKPDLITITGDFISFNPAKYTQEIVKILSALKAKDGVIAVLGNHDHYTDANAIRQALKQSGIIELENEIQSIRRDNSCIHIAGIDDFMTGHADLDKIISQIPNEEDTVILLAHEPDFADKSSKSGRFALQISGHTHGGQIRLPYYGNLFLPRYGRKYPSGKYNVGDMVVYTNRGLGTSWLKFRFNCPPELTIFQLKNNNFGF